MFVEKIDKTIGLAVSGGMDSMAMLHCYRLVSQNMVVINIEHGIRGESSRNDSAFVKRYCEANNIPFLPFIVNTLAESEKTKESVETVARRLRYEIFDRVLSENKVSFIALAHHADDNAETVLMRIFRGTGIRGLRGIIDRDSYIHPLIKYTRKEIEAFVAENDIPFITDETNMESDYTRNFIRLVVLPKIKERYQDVAKTIERLSQNACEVDEYLSAKIDNVTISNGQCHIKNLFKMDKILQKYAIREGFLQLDIFQDIEARHIDSIIDLQKKDNNTSIDMPYATRAIRHNNDLIITKTKENTSYSEEFDINKTYLYGNAQYKFVEGREIINGISIDFDKIPNNCVIRTRENGDIFKRVNGKTKLLSDFLNEQKLASTAKDNILVMANKQNILAILGYETADLLKIDKNTKKIIHIIKE